MSHRLRCWRRFASLIACCAALLLGCSESPRSSKASSESSKKVAIADTSKPRASEAKTPPTDSGTATQANNEESPSLPAEQEAARQSADASATRPPDEKSHPSDLQANSPRTDESITQVADEVKLSPVKTKSPSALSTPQAPERNVRAELQNPDGKDHVDPVKLNGEIFVGWPKPKVALLFSGAQDGYIEPCGCAGLENQKGGLSRRHQLIKKLTANGWPVAAFDAGGLVKRYGRQQELKYAAAVEALKIMDYRTLTFGGDDLRLSLTELLTAVTSVDGKPSPFVSTNAALISFEEEQVARHQVVEAGGMRFGVLAVVGEEERRKVSNPEIHFKRAAAAIAEMLPELKRAKCDKLILLAHSTTKEATDLAGTFGDFDYVVTTGDASEPPDRPEQIGERTRLISVGHKGMHCVVIGLYDNAKTPERYQRVPLDARFGESPAMQQILVQYQDQLRDSGLAGLSLIPPQGLRKHNKGQSYVGSAACGECHTQAYAIWEKTPHAHATDSIVKLSPPRHFDPECISCHVTGWNPQGYFPYASGYLALKQKHLHANGCENCHGPGSRHAAAQRDEIAVTDKELKALQLSMRVTLEEAEKNLCIQCHDLDNSPDYKWDVYWPQVEHKGKD